MDTSKEYIEICRKAMEIQEAWKPKEGDLVWHNADHRKESGDSRQFCQSLHILINGNRAEGRCPKMLHCSILGIFNLEDVKKPGPKHITWLPKQDQLQKMISSKWYNIWNIQSDFIKFAGGEYPFYPHCSLSHFHSMEQLWLAFIMKEKFNKCWDGKNWIDWVIKNKKNDHTRGPWNILSFDPDQILIEKDGRDICIIDDLKSGTDDANARLIAAAPDLLEACELILKEEISTLLSTELTEKAYKKINKAVKKAKGE